MLIVSAGMQKSGSAYIYNVINDIIIASGGTDARLVKEKHKLDSLMKSRNNNIGRLYLFKLLRLLRISKREGTFVVKTHNRPLLGAKLLGLAGNLKFVYSYRDPRDVLLSAIDHGRKIKAEGENHTFAKMVEFDKAIEHVTGWLRIWETYSNTPGTLLVKYEDMLDSPEDTTKRIERFLGISVDADERNGILKKYSRDNPGGDRRGMHFNKAQTYRYKSDMTQEQLEKSQQAFSKYLGPMGYELG